MNEFALPTDLRPDPGNTLFAAAAFGARPDLPAAGLPAAGTAAESWLRAVALGGQGRYAAARAELRRTPRLGADPALRSLALSTEASLLRQLGWHARAATLDGRALAQVAAGEPTGSPARDIAICDALTGLAADALGTARPALAARLLDRCQTPLERLCEAVRTPDIGVSAPDPAWRPRLRRHWVAAETALSAPDTGPALAHAESALALAEAGPSVRHRVKSRLLVAAAAAAAGDLDRSRELAALVAEQCRAHGLLPLQWACAMLRSGVSAGPAAAAAAAEAAACARALAGHGGLLRSDAGVLTDL
ncbi:hypothetical protein [Nocardia terpenica]|uniref:Uncharacterized protein n=1 Tax=Nocardia terpenica TaxID=455432 RepID=A0A291RDZ9_9NOCA|nr:hypothetical protein [Nocardia terpenica]ATL65831.1 hypothetical protein CRH09_05955 [Nocardia terpenica]